MDTTLKSQTISILHLEDNELDAELVSEILQTNGFSCTIKRVWTREAYEAALQDDSHFDVILADHNLPAFDGETALTIAAELTPNVSFIFLSGTLGEDVAVEAMRRGATDYVVKQKMDRLPQVLRRALQEVDERVGRRKAEDALRETEARFRRDLEQQVEERTAALLETEQLLQQSQKMDAIGKLTGGVAHDFNNLLSVIIGSLEMLRKRIPDDPELARLVDNAAAGAERGSALTKRMLAFARRQDLTTTSIDIRELVYGMADMVRRSLGPMVTLELSFPDDLPLVAADSNQLENALLNLILNGRDAMGGRGRIVVAAQVQTLHQSVGARKPGRYLGLAVTDFGSGMDAELIAKAVEPFFTTKGVGKGTGLGLSMVQGLAQQSGGELVLTSELGKGTTAEIWLPVAAGEAADHTIRPAEPEAALAEERPLKVLAVDDDALVLMNTVDMLEELGHRVVSVSSGKEALGQLSKEPFDLVVTDHAMPQMTGAELAEQIKSSYPDLPILLATGYAELPAGSNKALARLSKPFVQAELSAAIKKLIK